MLSVAPIIPTIRKEPFDDPAWLFELKLDGFRGLADTDNGRMLSKNGNRMKRFERLLERLPAGCRHSATHKCQRGSLQSALQAHRHSAVSRLYPCRWLFAAHCPVYLLDCKDSLVRRIHLFSEFSKFRLSGRDSLCVILDRVTHRL